MSGREHDKVLLRRYHEQGDLQAREQLIEQYMSLVRSLARRYSYRGEQLEDLVQIGAIGLIKAIDRFDLDRGVELTTYATPNIIGEIKRHFRDKGWSVRVPRGLQELNVQLSRLIEQLTVQLGRSPTISELAHAASVEEEEVLALARYPNVAMKATGAPSYSDQPYPFRDIHDNLRRLYDAFGPTRWFWGTDITRMPCPWRQCVTLFTEELPWLKGRQHDRERRRRQDLDCRM